MDLKGSLIDTNLKIYPTDKLIEFVKTIPPSDQIPHNVLQIINAKCTFKSYKISDLQLQLNNSDVENIKNIKEKVDKIFKDKSTENYGIETHVDTELKNSENDEKKNTNKEKSEMKEGGEKHDKNNKNRMSSKEFLNTNENCTETRPFLVTSDINWLYVYIKTRRNNGESNIPYLHKLLEGASIVLPENETIKRNPVLEARCIKLRAQEAAREYRKMTKGVDNVRMRFPEDSISYQLKQINRQLIAIGQFIISIFAGFLFGFRGVEWMVGNLDFGFRLLLGVMCALVIALAEIYFLAKKLNEELCVPETVQIGGPPKFADENSYAYKDNENTLNKLHQD